MNRYSNTFTLVLAERMNKRTTRLVSRLLGHIHRDSAKAHDCLVDYRAMKYMMGLDVSGERADALRRVKGLRVVRIVDAQFGRGVSAPFCGPRIDMGQGVGVRLTRKQWDEASA